MEAIRKKIKERKRTASAGKDGEDSGGVYRG